MSETARPVLHLIDGSGYIFRAFYAVPPMTTTDGTPTNAVVGFAKMLNKLLRQERPTALGMAFDTIDKNFRHQIYSDYKANRQQPPEELVPQFALIHELVESMDIPILMLSGYEADDILATLARKAVDAGYKVVVVSGDKDLMQLVGEHVSLFDPMKDRTFYRDDVIDRFGVPPELLADVLGLAGDTSDNIPGVPSVGPVTAAKLIRCFGNVDAVIEGLKKKSKRKANEEAVLAHQQQARISKRLATLAYDAPIKLEVGPLRYVAPNVAKLGPFLRRIEARGLMREYGITQNNSVVPPAAGEMTVVAGPKPAPTDAAHKEPKTADGAALSHALLTSSAPPAAAAPGTSARQSTKDVQAELFVQTAQTAPDRNAAPSHSTEHIDRTSYETISTFEALERVVMRIKKVRQLSVDLETTSLHSSQADIVGIALCVLGDAAVYVPIGHVYLGVPKQLPARDVLAILRDVLEDPTVIKWGQNLKYDFVVFRRAGIELKGIGHDAMLAAYVLDPARLSYSLDNLSREFLGHANLTYAQMTGTGKNRIGFAEVPIEKAALYAAEDADVAMRLAHLLVEDVQATGLGALYHHLEIPLVPVLATMEAHGVQLDTQHLNRLSKEFNKRLIALENKAFAEIGTPINLASPKQLSRLFFETLGYPVIKKTKTGFSTDQEVLETLAKTYDLPRIILEHRNLSKLKSTYIDALPRMINPHTKRLHTSFNQTGTATGRLSSSEPNLQNIPIRGDDGRRIRAAFTAPQGWEIISADYSQVELRVMAHLSEDPSFIEAFKNNQDIHRRTAMEILTQGEEPSSEMRRRAKAINFGILYGQSEFGLSKLLNIPRAEAQAYIAAYFGRYARIRSFMDKTIETGRTKGYVSTLLGRRRALPNLRSQNRNLRQAAERVAMNTPVQGTAADLIKLAMLKVAARLQKEQLKARLVLQVHDELVVESPLGESQAVETLLKEEMSTVLTLKVPIVVDVGHGANWADAH